MFFNLALDGNECIVSGSYRFIARNKTMGEPLRQPSLPGVETWFLDRPNIRLYEIQMELIGFLNAGSRNKVFITSTYVSLAVAADKFSLSWNLNQIRGKILPGCATWQGSNCNKSAIKCMSSESGFNSRQGKIFLCSPRHLGGHWASSCFVSGGYFSSLAGVKRKGRKTDHSSQSSWG